MQPQAAQYNNKILTCSLDIKTVSKHGVFAGYASVFDVVDNQQDIILPGAFAKSLQERKDDIKLLWQHQIDEPIGILEKIFEDEKGLYVEGRLLLNIRRAREAYDLIKAGALEGMSIGYKPIDYDYDSNSGVRLIKEVLLFEVSLVTFPANSAASITVVKGNQQPLLLELAESLDRAIAILRS